MQFIVTQICIKMFIYIYIYKFNEVKTGQVFRSRGLMSACVLVIQPFLMILYINEWLMVCSLIFS